MLWLFQHTKVSISNTKVGKSFIAQFISSAKVSMAIITTFKATLTSVLHMLTSFQYTKKSIACAIGGVHKLREHDFGYF